MDKFCALGELADATMRIQNKVCRYLEEFCEVDSVSAVGQSEQLLREVKDFVKEQRKDS